MDALLNDCRVESADRQSDTARESIGIINQLMSPVRPLTPDEVHVRTMLVTSDAVNSQGGRFAASELPVLSGMIPGTPVMVGHDKSKLPIARCFRSELVDRDGETWVKAWFYWLKSTSGSEDLRRNIDGGIYGECSLGFSFGLPECSICSGDIRKCSHIAGREYRAESGEIRNCHFLYRRISRVNEISLVYRGAVPGTAISDHRLSVNSRDNFEPGDDSGLTQAGSWLMLNSGLVNFPDDGVTLYPIYHGVPFDATQAEEKFRTSLPIDWAEFPPVKRAIGMLDGVFPVGSSVRGVVAMYRGKSRLPVHLMEKIKRGDSAHYGRCRIKLYVPRELRGTFPQAEMNRLAGAQIDAVSERIAVDRNQLDEAVESSPHEGLRIETNPGAYMLIRNKNRFLLEVARDSLTACGKHCYDLRFRDSDLGLFRSYETRISAAIGDTLYVEADIANLSGEMSLRRIRVLDNLQHYFEPDRLWSSPESVPAQASCFTIRRIGGDAAVLRFESGGETRQIAFPIFTDRQLNSGKILVGYDTGQTANNATTDLIDSGDAEILEKADNGLRFRLSGQRLSGDYFLRSAIHEGEKVILAYRASVPSMTTREIMNT